MTDLTNRKVEEVNALLQKYTPILEVSNIKTLQDAQIFVIIIDVAIKHIEEKHRELDKDWKAWSVVALKKQFKKLHTEEEVKASIDDFVEYHKTEYQNYIGEMNGFGYDLQSGFVHRYITKKIGR